MYKKAQLGLTKRRFSDSFSLDSTGEIMNQIINVLWPQFKDVLNWHFADLENREYFASVLTAGTFVCFLCLAAIGITMKLSLTIIVIFTSCALIAPLAPLVVGWRMSAYRRQIHENIAGLVGQQSNLCTETEYRCVTDHDIIAQHRIDKALAELYTCEHDLALRKIEPQRSILRMQMRTELGSMHGLPYWAINFLEHWASESLDKESKSTAPPYGAPSPDTFN